MNALLIMSIALNLVLFTAYLINLDTIAVQNETIQSLFKQIGVR